MEYSEVPSSSAISHIGWHEEAGLIVRFKSSNKIWAYSADRNTYITIMNAGSVGQEFDRRIKKPKVTGVEITEDELNSLLAGSQPQAEAKPSKRRKKSHLSELQSLLKSSRQSAYF